MTDEVQKEEGELEETAEGDEMEIDTDGLGDDEDEIESEE